MTKPIKKGVIGVKEFRTAAEMRAAFKKTRARLRSTRPPPPIVRLEISAKVDPSPPCAPPCAQDLQHDAHVTARKFIQSLPPLIDLLIVPKSEGRLGAVKMKDIASDVARKHDVTIEMLRGNNRAKQVAFARQEFCFRARWEARRSFPQIGEFLNGRDHSTIMHAVNRFVEWIAANNGERLTVTTMKDLLRQVARDYDVPVVHIQDQRRDADVVAARHAFCFRAVQELGKDYSEIARFLKKRDRTTIAHGVKMHAKRIKEGSAR